MNSELDELKKEKIKLVLISMKYKNTLANYKKRTVEYNDALKNYRLTCNEINSIQNKINILK